MSKSTKDTTLAEELKRCIDAIEFLKMNEGVEIPDYGNTAELGLTYEQWNLIGVRKKFGKLTSNELKWIHS